MNMTIRQQSYTRSYLAQQAERGLTAEQRRQRSAAIIFAVCLAVVLGLLAAALVQGAK